MIEKAKKLCSLGALHRNKKTIEAASLRFTSPRCAVLFQIQILFEYKPHCLSQHLYEHQQTHQHQHKHQVFKRYVHWSVNQTSFKYKSTSSSK